MCYTTGNRNSQMGGRMALSGSSKDNMTNKKNKEIEIERLKKIIGEQTIAIDAFKKSLETGGRKGQQC